MPITAGDQDTKVGNSRIKCHHTIWNRGQKWRRLPSGFGEANILSTANTCFQPLKRLSTQTPPHGQCADQTVNEGGVGEAACSAKQDGAVWC